MRTKLTLTAKIKCFNETFGDYSSGYSFVFKTKYHNLRLNSDFPEVHTVRFSQKLGYIFGRPKKVGIAGSYLLGDNCRLLS